MDCIATIITEIKDSFGMNWTFFIAQLLNFLIVVGLFALAARSILSRARGWEVPVWLLLAFVIPVVFPIIALIHFRKSKFVPQASPTSSEQG
jgi:4-amino-4-deoxy-L-arabinose transferase-like glycosyltransferase